MIDLLSMSVFELIEEVARERDEQAERLRAKAELNVQLLKLQAQIYDIDHTCNQFEIKGPKALIALHEHTSK